MLLGLATLTSVMCPVSAASLHTSTAPTSSVRSMNRRQRRASGERNKRKRNHLLARDEGNENANNIIFGIDFSGRVDIHRPMKH